MPAESDARASSTPDPFGLVGTLFADQYEVLRVVGEGGCAVVYAARHTGLGTQFAIKVMKRDVVAPERSAAFHEMFEAESRTLARLRHPAIVQVHESGLAVVPTGAITAWMALEWLEGITLDDWLEDRRGTGGMSPADALALLRPAFEAVAHAHEQGFAHRDLKPANLMMVAQSQGPRLRVMDFGVAKAMEGEGASSSGQTQTRSTIGGYSPPYAAPEQLARARTGPWTDVHALALILVELLIDRSPYNASSHAELFALVLSEKRPTPARFGVSVGAWEPVLARAMACAPASRYPSAGAFLAALIEALPAAQTSGSAQGPSHGLLDGGATVIDSAAAFRVAEAHLSATQAQLPIPQSRQATVALPAPRPSNARWVLVAVVLLAAIAAGVLGAKLRGAPSALSPSPSAARAR